MRLEAASLSFENGIIFFPNKAPWLETYKNELTSFPGSKHDDQVDSTSQFIEWMKAHGVEPAIITYYRMQLEDKQRRGVL